MLGPRWRKIIRDLWGNKTRTILVVMSIAVGIFAVGVIDSSREILIENLDEAYVATNPASATLYTEGFDDELLKAIRRVDDLSEADARYEFSTRYKVDGGDWHNLDIIAIPDYDDIRIYKFWPEQGAWPPKEGQIILERSSLKLGVIAGGDTIEIESLGDETNELQVAGIVHDVNQIPAEFTGRAYGYIDFDTLEKLGFERSYNRLHIVVAENKFDETHIRQVAASLRDDRIEQGGTRVFRIGVPEPGKHVMDSPLNAMIVLLEFLGLLSLLLSGFLVVNTISALLTQQTRQIGIMKAVGGVRRQIMGMYFVVIMVFGLLSLFVAIPLGVLGARAFTDFAAGLLNFDIDDFRISNRIFAIEVAIGLLVPALAALYPIISGTRVTVREAISSSGIKKSSARPGIIDRLVMTVKGLSRPLLLSLRNTFRLKGRLLLTLMTLIMASAVFVSVFTVRSSLLNTLDKIMDYWQYDIQVSFVQPYRYTQIERSAMRVPGVAGLEQWGQNGVFRLRPDGTVNENISMLAPPAETELIKPILLEGRWLIASDKNEVVVNTDLLKDEPDIEIGDELDLKIGGRLTKWKVVGVVKGQLAGPLIYANQPFLSQLTKDAGRATFVVVKTDKHDPSSQLAIARQLEERFKSVGVRVSGTETNGEIRSRIELQFNIIVIFLFIMSVLLAIVGGLGLMGTMSINALERTREIGVMRAIGASNISVVKVFVVEGIIIGTLSWLLGTILSLPLSRVLSHLVGVAFLKVPLDYKFSMAGVLIWFAIILLISTLASLLPAYKAARLSVREILGYE